ncbi:patatin-like phospholipase family protein [Streptomyces sp. NPDC052107]|uniref:patatin-like phospholipase family protein n=1 Tax=Streptomyces sp. NPDC052107 TaxID=3155632 RepID=UPI003447715C
MSDKQPNVDLVLEGGGVKGIGLLGAVLVLAEHGYRFPRIAGTSAGAIVGALVAAYQKAGKDLHDLVGVMKDLQYSRFADSPLPGPLGRCLTDGVELLLHEGAHSGQYLTDWLGPQLEAAGVRTFADLAISPEDDMGSSLAEYQRYSLVVHASDLSRRVLVRLPWDYEQYGKQPREQRVVDAVRASMSIPLYFQPVQVETGNGTATWVDGGLLSNFPITAFDRTDGLPARWPSWGVKLSSRPTLDTPDRPVRTALQIATACVETRTGDWNRYHLHDEGVDQRTIYVDTMGVSSTDFGLSTDTRNQLLDNGRQAATAFLDRQKTPGHTWEVIRSVAQA